MTQQIRMCLWIAFVACLVACTSAGNDPAATAVPANQPNPASVHCQEQGGRLEIRTGEGGEYGVCVFADGSECDEWAFYRGECQPADEPAAGLPNPASVHCQKQGGRLEIRTGEGGEYGVCVFTDGSECDEWAFFRGECQPGSTDQ